MIGWDGLKCHGHVLKFRLACQTTWRASVHSHWPQPHFAITPQPTPIVFGHFSLQGHLWVPDHQMQWLLFSTHLILSTTHSCSSLQLGCSLSLPLTSPLVLSLSLSWSSLTNFLIQASFLPTLSSPSAPLVEGSLAWTSHLPSLSIPDLHFHCQLNWSVVSRDSHVPRLKYKPDLPPLLCFFFYFLLNLCYSSFSHLHYKSWKCSQECIRLWIHLVHTMTFSTFVNTCLIN